MPVKRKVKSRKKKPKVVSKRKYTKKTPKIVPKKKTPKKKIPKKKTPKKKTPKVTHQILEIPNKDHPSSLNGNFNDGVWIVLYHATWCPHCTEMKPEWD